MNSVLLNSRVRRQAWCVALFGLLGAAAASAQGSATQGTANGPAQAACARLAGLALPAASIGLPTTGATVQSAELVLANAANNPNGEYCKVQGAIHPVDYSAPDIRFQVNLPTAWNGKTLQFGGGGFNGSLVTGLDHYAKQPPGEARPLARGYVTLGSDSGHVARTGGFDGRFLLNDEALRNYGHEQIKKTHDVAVALIAARYGRAAQYHYIIGGSQGGHEAFDAVQRYPDDYHGAVAGYPAHNVLMLHLSANRYAAALHANNGASWLDPAKVASFTAAVYKACDALDEAPDGIISNIAACRTATATFKLKSGTNPLRCAAGADTGPNCLSDAQIDALNTLDAPFDLGFSVFADDEGNSLFPKWTPFEGSTFQDGGFPNLGAKGPGEALQMAPGDATPRYAVTQDLTLDSLKGFDPRRHAGRIAALAPVLSANSVNLDRFRARGGKLIYFHGLVDDFITPYSSIQYWERLNKRYASEALGSFVKFYTVPGMGHVTGVFNARIATLDALEAWVEKGQAPAQLEASDVNPKTAGRTRPVCHYPEWPRYVGSGSLESASSFRCVRP